LHSSADNKDGVLRTLDSLAAEMRKRLESSQSIRHFDRPLYVKMTSSIEALKAFTQGYDLAAKGEFGKSVPFYTRALELDPNFAAAHADLGTLYNNLGEKDLSTANLTSAYALRDHATNADRLFIIGQYHSIVTGNIYESIRNYDTWTQMYPKDSHPWANRAQLQITLGNADQAIADAKQSLELDPQNGVAFYQLARAQTYAGQTDQAMATCRLAIERKLDGKDIHGVLVALAFLGNDQAALEQEYAWAKGKTAEPYIKLWEMLGDLARGRRAAAMEAGREMVEGYRKQGIEERAQRMRAGIPRILAELGWTAEAKAMLAALPAINGSTNIPVAMTETGDIAKAEAIARRGLQEHPEDTIWQEQRGPEILAAAALARRQPQQAIEALRAVLGIEASGLDTLVLRGRAYLAAGKPELAAAEFQKAIEHPGWAPLSYEIPMAHLGLARVYAIEGNRAASRSEYEKLFELWKDADADLPAKQEAALEMRRLR
jgi:tetratricopeptide (TPR) repeat protein